MPTATVVLSERTTQYQVAGVAGVTALNACGDVALGTVWTSVLVESHVEVVDEYSFAVMGDVPPATHVAVTVTVCPLSIVGVRGVRVGVGNAPFTITVSVTEVVTWAADMPLATVVLSDTTTQ